MIKIALELIRGRVGTKARATALGLAGSLAMHNSQKRGPLNESLGEGDSCVYLCLLLTVTITVILFVFTF